jgi:hypothetical protein
VIFAGTSGAYFGAAPGVLAGVCATLAEGDIAIAPANAMPNIW